MFIEVVTLSRFKRFGLPIQQPGVVIWGRGRLFSWIRRQRLEQVGWFAVVSNHYLAVLLDSALQRAEVGPQLPDAGSISAHICEP